jgi:hypothetical protein
MSNRRRFFLIVLLMSMLSLISVLVVLSPNRFADSWNKPPIVAITVIFILIPIYPLFRRFRLTAGAFALAILLLIGALISGLGYVVGDFVLHRTTGWVPILSNLSEALFLASFLTFIWNGVTRKNT